MSETWAFILSLTIGTNPAVLLALIAICCVRALNPVADEERALIEIKE
jgi:hypothetical protein